MKILHLRLVKQNIYSIIAVLLSLFSFALLVTNNYYLMIGMSLLFVAIIKKWKYIVFSLIFFLILLIIYTLSKSSPVYEKLKGDYNVIKKTWFGFLINHKGQKIFVFSRINVLQNDEVFISGQPYLYKGKMENYFRSLNVKSVLSNAFIKKTKISHNLVNNLRFFLINANKPYDKLVSLLFFGEKNIINNNFYKMTSQMNISYLFVISGFHISLLYFVITKSLFFLKKINKDIVSFIIIFTYILIIGLPISALRALIMLYISVFARYTKKIKLSKIEIMAISLVILVLIYPYSIFGYSLPLTFISTFIILNIVSLQISIYKKTLMIPFIMFGFMLPFTILFNGQISLFAPFYSLLITPIFIIFYILLILFLPLKSIIGELCNWFIIFIEKMKIINLIINIDKNLSWIFFMPYVLLAISFIIYEIWNLYLDKKNI